MSVPIKRPVMQLLHAPTHREVTAVRVTQGTAEMVSLVQVIVLCIEMFYASRVMS